MAFRPDDQQPDFSSLITSLDNSKTQTSNYSLYQTIFFLIQNTQRARALILKDIKELETDLNSILDAELLTASDETAVFPNSRELLAGTGITFDDTIANQRTINSSGGVAGAYYDSPLSDGDLIEAHLIFGNGDPIICQVPNVP